MRRMLRVIEGAGGSVTSVELTVPAQTAQEPPLEQWDPGRPTRRILYDDPDWTWKGAWKNGLFKHAWGDDRFKEAGGAGDEASLSFDGTGLAIVGRCLQEGGRADVFLDGARADPLDAWIPERTNDDDYWHVTGLAPGRHTVRIVVRGDADPGSKGHEIQIERAIVYAPR